MSTYAHHCLFYIVVMTTAMATTTTLVHTGSRSPYLSNIASKMVEKAAPVTSDINFDPLRVVQTCRQYVQRVYSTDPVVNVNKDDDDKDDRELFSRNSIIPTDSYFKREGGNPQAPLDAKNIADSYRLSPDDVEQLCVEYILDRISEEGDEAISSADDEDSGESSYGSLRTLLTSSGERTYPSNYNAEDSSLIQNPPSSASAAGISPLLVSLSSQHSPSYSNVQTRASGSKRSSSPQHHRSQNANAPSPMTSSKRQNTPPVTPSKRDITDVYEWFRHDISKRRHRLSINNAMMSLSNMVMEDRKQRVLKNRANMRYHMYLQG